MIKAVLFDFDGTVMDTEDIILKSWQHTYMTIEGKEHDEDEIRKTFGEVLATTMKRVFPQRPFEECLEIYRSYQRNIFAGAIKPFPGIKELIEKLDEKGIKMAMVTSRTKVSLVDALKANDMLKYFPVLVTCDDTNIHKPNPEPALIALKELGVKPSEAIMVGDSRYDIECAKNAGVTSVLVSWSTSLNKSEIENTGADYLISDAMEILDLC